MDDLRVFDPEAVVGDRDPGQRLFEFVEYRAIRSVADGMDIHLEAGPQRLDRNVPHASRRDEGEARVPRVVRVRLDQRCTARPQSAIRRDLDGLYPEPSVVQAGLRPALDVVVDGLVVVRDHDVVTDVEPPLARHFLVNVDDRAAHARVVNTRQAPAVHLGDRGLDRGAYLFTAGRWDTSVHEAHGCVYQDAGGTTVLGALDAAA